MRYMYLVSSGHAGPPPQKLMEEIHELATQERAAGRMIVDGGLTPLSEGARIEVRRGKLKVHDGPFAETKEVIGGFAIFEFATREEALASAVNFMELHRLYAEGWEGVCEMRQIMG
jgi:hypothetical protein